MVSHLNDYQHDHNFDTHVFLIFQGESLGNLLNGLLGGGKDNGGGLNGLLGGKKKGSGLLGGGGLLGLGLDLGLDLDENGEVPVDKVDDAVAQLVKAGIPEDMAKKIVEDKTSKSK